MAYPLINLSGTESEGTKWQVLQAWLRLAVTNAGITIPMSDPLLSDINLGDSEGTKWAKLQRWMTLLAQNISGGGGAGVSSIIAGSGISVDQPTGAVTITATAGAPTNYATATNNSGNTTTTPDKPIYTEAISVGGSARTSVLILVAGGATVKGDKIRLDLTLAATAGIILEVRNATSGGTLLLPAEIFPSQQFTTDGTVLSAVWDFVFTGAAWKYEMSNIPA